MDKVPSNISLKYTGKRQPKAGERDRKGRLLSPYQPDDALVEAVNLAIFLERPLLIRGEPGCGKTRLASAVAYELGLECNPWHIKSTSRARDGLYSYDTVARLRDVQLAAVGRLKDEDIARIDNPDSYIKYGPLGKAFLNEHRTVVLIDEIDKADIDFPNDLLVELDERRFFIEEVGVKEKEVPAKQPPIVFITSNDERDLPDAFLRRCLFHYITFPERSRLIEIVQLHFRDAPEMLVSKAVDRFWELRRKMVEDKGEAGKKVSTSELIDWFRILSHEPVDEALAAVNGRLPASILLKSWDDHLRYLGLIETRV